MRILRSLFGAAVLAAAAISPAAADAPAGAPRALIVAPGCTLVPGELPDPAAPCGLLGTPAAATDACTVALPGVDDRCESWRARLGLKGGINESIGLDLAPGRSMTVSPDGATVYAIGAREADPSSAFDEDLLVHAIDAATGSPRWTRVYEGTAAYPQAVPVTVAATPDGQTVLALAHLQTDEFGRGSCGFAVLAYDALAGTPAWDAVEPGAGDVCTIPWDLAMDPGGARAYVTASSARVDGGAAVKEGLTVAYDVHDGSVAWRAPYAGRADGAFTSALRPSPDGASLYVAGTSGPDTGLTRYIAGDVTLLRYDAADGTLGWEASFPAAGNGPAGVAVSPDGARVFAVAGAQLPGTPDFDILTYALDAADGTLAWRANYNGPKPKSSFDSVWYRGPIAVAPSGDVYVAGYSSSLRSANIASDFVTIAYDPATGAERWLSRYLSELDLSWTPALALSPDGDTVYTSGPTRNSFDLTLARITALAYDAATGAQRWVGRHTDGYTYFGGSALAPDGSALYAGAMTAELDGRPQDADYDAVVVAYATQRP